MFVASARLGAGRRASARTTPTRRSPCRPTISAAISKARSASIAATSSSRRAISSCMPTRCTILVADGKARPHRSQRQCRVRRAGRHRHRATPASTISAPRTITLTGRVVLTKEKNVMRGTKLVDRISAPAGAVGCAGSARRARSGIIYPAAAIAAAHGHN